MSNNISEYKDIGTKIKELRKEHEISQSDLALRMNFTKSAISKWENGKSEPDLQSVKQLAKIFSVDLNSLIDEDSETKKVEPLYKKNGIKTSAGKIALWTLYGEGMDLLAMILLFAFVIPFGILSLFFIPGAFGIAYIVSDVINTSFSVASIFRILFFISFSPILVFIFWCICSFITKGIKKYIPLSLDYFWGYDISEEHYIMQLLTRIEWVFTKIFKSPITKIFIIIMITTSVMLFTISGISIATSNETWEIFNLRF